MIAVVYRIQLHPGVFDEYRLLWSQMVAFLKEQRGAIGSVLHRGDDHVVVIYSRWPSLKVYQQSWPDEDQCDDVLPPAMVQVALKMKACVCVELAKDVLQVVDDQCF